MSGPDWNRLMGEARDARTGDYVDRGVIWADNKLTHYEAAIDALLESRNETNRDCRMREVDPVYIALAALREKKDD